MTTSFINTLDAKEQFTDLINRVAHNQERFVLTRRGKEVAVIISMEDFKLIQDVQDKNILNEAIDALKEARQVGTFTLDQLKQDMSQQ